MKSRIPPCQILIILETDLSQSNPLNEDNLTPIQKTVYNSLSEEQKDKIAQGYGAVYEDLETNTEICSFNMEYYKPPKCNMDILARSILEECKKFYSDPENVKKFEEWKKQQDTKIKET